jgi:hypothetical protein
MNSQAPKFACQKSVSVDTSKAKEGGTGVPDVARLMSVPLKTTKCGHCRAELFFEVDDVQEFFQKVTTVRCRHCANSRGDRPTSESLILTATTCGSPLGDSTFAV